MKKRLIFILILGSSFGLQLFSQTGSPIYSIKKTIKIGGKSLKWDYITIDKGSYRAFIANGNCVQVVDLTKDKERLVGTIKNTPGVHGIAIVPDANRGFITCGDNDSILSFDLKTFKITSKVKSLGKNPDFIMFDMWSYRVFAFNAGGFSVVSLDPKTGEIVGMLMLPGNPEAAVTDGYGTMWVHLESVNAIAKIDTKTLKITGIFSLGEAKQPTGIAYDNKYKKLFSGCRGSNQLMVTEIYSGDVVDSTNIGTRCDGVSFVPETGDILTSNGEGTINVIQRNDSGMYKGVQMMITKHGARTIVYDENGKRFLLPYAEWSDTKKEYIPGTFGILVVSR
ncbi:MAG: hypothetical protein WCL00_02920 [Bacteroidota bacterium]